MLIGPKVSRGLSGGEYARLFRASGDVPSANGPCPSALPAEKLRATDGPWQRFARMYEEDFPEVLSCEELTQSHHLYLLYTDIKQYAKPNDRQASVTSSSASLPSSK